jgi:predicted DNA-binding transcriptional regulator AlpA
MPRPSSAKLQDQLCYPPRLMRAERAAAYLGFGVSFFLELVAEGRLPKPKRIKGVVAWDRLKLDAFVDDADDAAETVNSVEAALRGG